ncbi:hypothetical protein [Nonomuraea soli]|uniref:Uncharacterized protein n=1 Tax=Nonomuraea soli TaxID=1032476 RepID=A0A7W0CGD5_9ACTN|nr:hypothetical protein [Nonomuraea soli]MBA2890507.1 hypothetical protein [Nonomuraea soli]
MSSTIEVIIEAVGEVGLTAGRLRELAAEHPQVMEYLETTDTARLIVADTPALGHEPHEGSPFRAKIFDPVSNRAVELRGTLDRPAEAEVRPSAYRPVPGAAELEAAAGILRADPAFPAGDDVVVYRPMPPLADRENPDGTTTRRPTLALYTPSAPDGVRHRVVAVDLRARTVDWAPAGDPEPVNLRMHHDCEKSVPAPVGSLPDRGGPGRVRLTVLQNGMELWNLIVVRPRNSSGDAGSGVELQDLRHRGRLVLRRAHVPILNVEYQTAERTTFRDWVNEETRFTASGSDPVGAGWRLCDSPPQTILERPSTDTGGFQGVAFHYDEDKGELRIVSELAAGWYRYASDWRLAEDGTIRPRFGFAATKDPMTCQPHRHHAYWRLDFDVEGSDNDVVEQFPEAVRIVRETTRKRVPGRFWRVTDKSSGRGYEIRPGRHDGTADDFGISDLWFLRHRASEIYDEGGDERNRAMLNRFVNGENIAATNVVVWYGGHFFHNQNDQQSVHQGHIVGPDLRPVG